MCGIFGLVVNTQLNLTKNDFDRAIRLLFKLSEPRGREAAGLAIASENITVYKHPMKSSAMIKSLGFAEFLNNSISSSTTSNRLVMPVAAIGHTRLVTSGTQVIHENNQPIVSNHIVGVHNGIIANEDSLFCLYPDSKKPSGTDSALLFGLIDKFYAEGSDLSTAITKTYQEISGSASIALFSDNLPVLVLATNTGSLYYSYSNEHGFVVFGSERYIVEQFFQKSGLFRNYNHQTILQLNPFTGMIINFENVVPEVFSLMGILDKRECMQIFRKKVYYKIMDVSIPKKELSRCTKCVLPETYPFISYDENGICNYCQKYKKQMFHGRAALEALLGKYRSKNGKPDCIVGFSGGRDSCYGLHVLKTEFGMNPIAYTYDWALITEQSRRNQAKVVGKLGIEHIIRAADIHTKRRYIRKNIYAWLKKPELGMVPLFMAGDKMFYYYGRQLRKETGIKLTIFAAGQQVEQMEFKIGFCGIDQNVINNTRLYQYDFMVKLRLAMWYIKQYLTNPSYLNESLVDSIFAFYSSFINKDDYLYLYHYIPWDEKLIERTLKEEYGWETDEKYGKNQWRMGDGHTAFIDYIWYTVAGFSEYDNFRSNQIREGFITREEALELIEEDNKPRMEMLQDFSQLIGFNLEEVLLKINSIPKLY